MSATVGGAVKALVETGGLGVAVYVRTVPDGTALPYVLVTPGVGVGYPGQGDTGGADTPVIANELVQIDVYQARRAADGLTVTERLDLPDALALVLARGRNVPGVGTGQVFGVRLQDAQDLPDPDPNIVHRAFTVLVVRLLR